jgi:hypothetical protein
MLTVASVLPVSEWAVRNRRFAVLSCGKLKMPLPVLGVVVSSAVAPLSRPTL